jgi:hypothetical protein
VVADLLVNLFAPRGQRRHLDRGGVQVRMSGRPARALAKQLRRRLAKDMDEWIPLLSKASAWRRHF